jgi:hypothetical protein
MLNISDVKNKSECLNYVKQIEHTCNGMKTSPLYCEKLKLSYLKYCYDKFHNSSENNSICLSDNTLGGNTLNDTIKSPNTSEEREKPFPLIIFSSRF